MPRRGLGEAVNRAVVEAPPVGSRWAVLGFYGVTIYEVTRVDFPGAHFYIDYGMRVVEVPPSSTLELGSESIVDHEFFEVRCALPRTTEGAAWQVTKPVPA